MFQIKDGSKYDLYNNINEDPFSYKYYNITNSKRVNSHDMIEVVLDTNDTTLLGASSSI